MPAARFTLDQDAVVGIVDLSRLPDEVVEALAAQGALLTATDRRAGDYAVHRSPDGFTLIRPASEPAAVVTSITAYRRARVRSRASGLVAGALAMMPATLTLPPVITL